MSTENQEGSPNPTESVTAPGPTEAAPSTGAAPTTAPNPAANATPVPTPDKVLEEANAAAPTPKPSPSSSPAPQGEQPDKPKKASVDNVEKTGNAYIDTMQEMGENAQQIGKEWGDKLAIDPTDMKGTIKRYSEGATAVKEAGQGLAQKAKDFGSGIKNAFSSIKNFISGGPKPSSKPKDDAQASMGSPPNTPNPTQMSEGASTALQTAAAPEVTAAQVVGQAAAQQANDEHNTPGLGGGT